MLLNLSARTVQLLLLLLPLFHVPHAGLGARVGAGVAADTAVDESCDADATLLDAQGFAQSYTLTGCSNPSHCGVYYRVDARCLKDYTEGGLCGKNQTLCDEAPVYQLESAKTGQDRPILYRWSPYGRYSEWRVAPSARLADCEGYGALLRSPAAKGRPSPGAPTDPAYTDDAGGWFDTAAARGSEANASEKVTIFAGGS